MVQKIIGQLIRQVGLGMIALFYLFPLSILLIMALENTAGTTSGAITEAIASLLTGLYGTGSLHLSGFPLIWFLGGRALFLIFLIGLGVSALRLLGIHLPTQSSPKRSLWIGVFLYLIAGIYFAAKTAVVPAIVGVFLIFIITGCCALAGMGMLVTSRYLLGEQKSIS